VYLSLTAYIFQSPEDEDEESRSRKKRARIILFATNHRSYYLLFFIKNTIRYKIPFKYLSFLNKWIGQVNVFLPNLFETGTIYIWEVLGVPRGIKSTDPPGRQPSDWGPARPFVRSTARMEHFFSHLHHVGGPAIHLPGCLA
jgi:hypothetical protein